MTESSILSTKDRRSKAAITHRIVMIDLDSDPETNLWIAINKAQRVVFYQVNMELRQNNLPSLHWYDILWSIERRGRALRPFELEEELIFEQSNLSHLLRRIEKMASSRFQNAPGSTWAAADYY